MISSNFDRVIVFDPFVPEWALAAIALIAVMISFVSLLRAPLGGVFRVIALAALIGLIANPQLRLAEKTGLDDIAIILVDRSASQSLDGRMAITDAAAAQLQTRLSALGAIETRIIDVDGAEETRLIEALTAAAGEAPRARLAAVFAITDGQASDIETVRSALRTVVGVPVHVMTTGRDGEVDRKITLVNAPRYGIVREAVKISFRVEDVGPDNEPVAAPGGGVENVEVGLKVDGQEIFRQPVPLGAEVSFDAPLSRPGALVIELEAAPRAGELTTRNNTAVLPITSIRDRLRVLLISGEPHPGERVWRNLLKSDPAIDLVHFTILRPLNKSDTALQHELALIPFPQDELFIEKLSEFDLLIFDRYTYRGVLNAFHFDNIARYVERGGGVLIAAGPEYVGPLSLASRQTLSFILPAIPRRREIETAFRPRISEVGARHPVTADLPEQSFWGRWLRIMPVTQRSGRSLMENDNGEPLLILDHVGDGRIGLLLSDHVWLWARGFDGGGPHAELLRRIAHWLMKEPELEEEQLRLSAAGENLLIERRTLDDAAAPVTLTLPDGTAADIELEEQEPGLYSASLENAPRGLYRATSGDLFAVGSLGVDAPTEFLNVVSAPEKMRPLTDLTNGGLFKVRRGDTASIPAVRRVRENGAGWAGAGWAGVIRKNAERIDAVKSAPLTSPWIWLSVIGLALICAWRLEGRR